MKHLGLALILLAACNGKTEETTDDGAGGTGGMAPGCPVGSHDDGAGVCVAALGPFAETAGIAAARDHHVTWTAHGFIYIAGGAEDMTTATQSIERAAIQPDGALAAWETLPQTFASMGPIVASTEGRLLFGGGVRGGGVSNASDTAVLNADGSLGDIEPGPTMNVERFHGAAVLHDGWVYASGGLDGTGTSGASIERIAFDDDGFHDEWILEAEEMPEPRSHHGLALHTTDDGAALYVTGGLTRVNNDFANDVSYNTVLRSVIGADGSIGAWTEIGTLPAPIAVHASFVHAGQLYIVHGLDMIFSVFVNLLHRATILEDGTLGPWEQLPSMVPIARGHCHQVPIVDGFLYSIAGTNELGSQTNAFFAKFE